MKIKMHIRDDRYNLESFVCIFLYEVFFALSEIYITIGARGLKISRSNEKVNSN